MERIMNLVMTGLQEAGIPAVRAFPGGMMPQIVSPVVAVSLESLSAVDGGFGRSLGEAGTGRQVEATVLLRLFSPDGRGEGDVCAVLMRDSLLQKVSLSEPYFDREADCFVTRIRAQVTGLLSDAQAKPDETAFTDFSLEGEIR